MSLKLTNNKCRAFTLLEILLVIALIAILAAVVIIAINPARQMSQTNNVRRQSDIKSILSAVNQYSINNGSFPPGVDTTLKMIGTATSGCDVSCERNIGEKSNSIIADKDESIFSLGKLVDVADAQTVPQTAGWVSPTGFEDPGNQWSSEPNAYDNNINTYAQNEFGQVGWGQYIVLTLSNPINSNRLRINADYLDSAIQEVDVDVYKDGAWVDVFQGGDESDWNCKWVELSFPTGSVTNARFRYNYKVGGWYYWLYEFQFYQTATSVVPPTCITQNPTSVSENSAILNGTIINDGGEPCQYRFQYGETTNYDNNTPWRDSLSTGDTFGEFISGLQNSTDYHFQAQAENSAGITNCSDERLTTGSAISGWLPPTSYNDPDNKWQNQTYAYDGSTLTFARSYHNSGDPQWSSFIYFNHVSILSNSVRFYARGGSQVDAVELDVYKDGVWDDVYQGAFNDQQWVEEDFIEGNVSGARIRFSAANTSQGFYWELYEFDFNKASEPTNSACLDLSSALVPQYLSDIPFDPTVGSAERTYYAIQEDANDRIIIKACGAELEKDIIVNQ